MLRYKFLVLCVLASLVAAVAAEAQVVPSARSLAGLYAVRLEVTEARSCSDVAVGDITTGLLAIDATGGGSTFAARWATEPRTRVYNGPSVPGVLAGAVIQLTWNPGGVDQDSALLTLSPDGSLGGQLRSSRGSGCTVTRNLMATRVR